MALQFASEFRVGAENAPVNRRLFWLAPLSLFLGGCAVSASGADVPNIADLPTSAPVTAASHATKDPVELVRGEIQAEFEDTAFAASGQSITESNGIVTIVMDEPATTLSAAEVYLRFCKAAADVIEGPDMPSSVKGISVLQPDGRTIAAATSAAPACFYR